MKKSNIGISILVAFGMVITLAFLSAILEVRKEEIKEKYLSGEFDNKAIDNSASPYQTLEVYSPPQDWHNHEIQNTLTISIPNTLELRKQDDFYTKKVEHINWYGYKIDSNNVVFQQKGLSTAEPDALKTYCRILINVEKGNLGDYMAATDCQRLDDETVRYFQELAKQSAGAYELLTPPVVRWIQVGNIFGIESEYIRSAEESNQTCVYSYYFFNNDRMAQVTLSYRKSDSDIWKKDVSNVIRTFKWL